MTRTATINTINELIELLNLVDQDATVLARISNDSELAIGSGPGPGLVTTRLGATVKNVRKIIADIEAGVVEGIRPVMQIDGVTINNNPDTINFINGGITVVDTGQGGVTIEVTDIDISSQVTGDLPVDNLDSGTNANATTFWRGDGTWSVPAGGGDVSKVGTPVDNQIGVWTGDGTIEGQAGLTWDGSTLNIDGDIVVTGSVAGNFNATDIVDAINTELGSGAWQSGGGSVPVEDDGTEIVVAPTALNFTGAGVTVTDVSGVATIDISSGGTVDVVSNVATSTVLGRTTAGSGDSEELTPAQVRTLINVADGADVSPVTSVAGEVGVISAADLRTAINVEDGATADQTGAELVTAIDTELGSGAWQSGGGAVPIEDDSVQIVAAPTALNFTGAGITVTDVGGVATIDVPGGGGGTVDVVSNVATSTILGRTTAGSGDSEELTPAQARTLLNVADGADVSPVTSVAGETGVISAADLRTALNVEDGATADQTGAEIVTAIDTELGSNAWQSGGVSNAVEARYWRWTFDENTNWPAGVTVSEIEAFTDSAATGTDILTGGTASAERVSYGGVAASGFDDNGATFWGSDLNLQGAGNPETWIQYDLGAGNEAWVVEYTMQARPNVDSGQMASGWYMSYSLDGVNWIRVDTQSGETGWSSSEVRTFVNTTASTGTVNDRTYGWDPANIVIPDYFIIENMTAFRETGATSIEHFAVSKTAMPATGIHYYEILVTGTVADMQVGLIDPDSLGDADSTTGGTGLHDNGLVWRAGADGDVFLNGSDTTVDWNAIAADDVLRFAWDADNNRLYWGQSGSATKDIVIPGTVSTDYVEFTGLSGNPHIAVGIARDDGRAELRTRANEVTEAIPTDATILEPTVGATPVNEIVSAINAEIGNDDWQTPSIVSNIQVLAVNDVHDVVLADAGKIFEVAADASSYSIVRIPDDTTLNLPIGFTCSVVKTVDDPAYDPEIAALNGSVSINGAAGGGVNVTGALYSAVTVYKSAANSWIAFGAI
jgi:hypothetical protein